MGGYAPQGGGSVQVVSMPNVNIATMPNVEEQYQLQERKALAVTDVESSYTITTSEPKVVTLIADGCDMQVDTQAITGDSPKLVDGASLSMTLKGVATTIYAKAPGAGDTGTLYIMVFK